MASLTLTSLTTLSGVYTDALDNTTPRQVIAISASDALTAGTGANQANAFFEDTRSIAGGSFETLDLTSTLEDAFGNTLLFTKIKFILIENQATTTAFNLTLSGNIMAAFLGDGTDSVVVGPGGMFYLSSPRDGYTVTNTTQDQLTISPGANTIIYRIFIAGVV